MEWTEVESGIMINKIPNNTPYKIRWVHGLWPSNALNLLLRIMHFINQRFLYPTAVPPVSPPPQRSFPRSGNAFYEIKSRGAMRKGGKIDNPTCNYYLDLSFGGEQSQSAPATRDFLLSLLQSHMSFFWRYNYRL